MSNPETTPCQHRRLTFGSGDYYLSCCECGARWGRISYDQPEYGQSADGTQIGCAPELANQGFHDNVQDRVRPDE